MYINYLKHQCDKNNLKWQKPSKRLLWLFGLVHVPSANMEEKQGRNVSVNSLDSSVEGVDLFTVKLLIDRYRFCLVILFSWHQRHPVASGNTSRQLFQIWSQRWADSISAPAVNHSFSASWSIWLGMNHNLLNEQGACPPVKFDLTPHGTEADQSRSVVSVCLCFSFLRLSWFSLAVKSRV